MANILGAYIGRTLSHVPNSSYFVRFLSKLTINHIQKCPITVFSSFQCNFYEQTPGTAVWSFVPFLSCCTYFNSSISDKSVCLIDTNLKCAFVMLMILYLQPKLKITFLLHLLYPNFHMVSQDILVTETLLTQK